MAHPLHHRSPGEGPAARPCPTPAPPPAHLHSPQHGGQVRAARLTQPGLHVWAGTCTRKPRGNRVRTGRGYARKRQVLLIWEP